MQFLLLPSIGISKKQRTVPRSFHSDSDFSRHNRLTSIVEVVFPQVHLCSCFAIILHRNLKMSSENSANSSDNENTCVVCFKNVDIYSIGICDHPVCFECSTRMRVLCKQNECPMCRQDMPKVRTTYAKRFYSTCCNSSQSSKTRNYFQNI